MTTLPRPADPTTGFTATYDAWNRLVKLSDGANTVQENEYDGRRFRIVRKDYNGGTLTETRHFYYSAGWQALEERIDTSSNANRQAVWGVRYIDDLVLRDRDTTGSGVLDERLYALQDANWNMIALADAAGTVQERYAYSAYGTPRILSAGFVPIAGSNFEWDMLYCGYRIDPGGLYYVRNRYLHSELGNWISRDPIGYRDGMSLYAAYFVPDDTDSSGLQPEAQVVLMEGIRANSGGSYSYPKGYWPAGGSPEKFFGKPDHYQRGFHKAIEKEFGSYADAAARRNCVPREALLAIIANEMIDYTYREQIGESWGFGESLGPAQIHERMLYNPRITGFIPSGWHTPINKTNSRMRRQMLMNPRSSIDIAGRLMRVMLDDMCRRSKMNKCGIYRGFGKFFLREVAGISQPSIEHSQNEFKDFLEQVCRKDCENIPKMDASDTLIRGLQGAFNDYIPDIYNNPNINVVDHVINIQALDDIYLP